ncbi:MAG: BLUF domain-containing protein [Rhodanobacter sp.]
MDQLTAVVYRSQAVRPMSVRELDDLLVGARAFNEKAEVSGALLHHQGAFLQYFEGSRESVERVYARIRRAREHGQLVELSYQPIDTRQFSRWHMAFSEPPLSVLEEIANEMWTMILPAVHAGQARSPGLQHLLDFWQRANPDA